MFGDDRAIDWIVQDWARHNPSEQTNLSKETLAAWRLRELFGTTNSGIIAAQDADNRYVDAARCLERLRREREEEGLL